MTDEIQDILTDILARLGVSHSAISVVSIADQTIIKVETDHADALIGHRGDTIRALDYVVKKIAEKKGITNARFLIDVNGYRVRHIEELQSKARMMAERARSLQYDVELTPMSAYERLIVHTTLSDDNDVVTESQGEGTNRRVVIRYTTPTTPSPAEQF